MVGQAGDMATMATRGSKAEFMTVATLADSRAVKCAAEMPSMEAAVSTAEVAAKHQVC